MAVEHWPTGVLDSEMSYADGIEDGWLRNWHDIGVLSRESFYQKGRATGTRKEWHRNGRLKLEVSNMDNSEYFERSDHDGPESLAKSIRRENNW
ncbi:MAG TPA: hypothetical protein VJ302_28690 [Blastocatellia bacterium]|nr:hypothetical protein [Blastocatellia bacterium]